MQRIQQSLETAQTPREPSITPRGGSASVRKVPRNPWLDRETSHERLVRESSGISLRDQPMSGTAPYIICIVYLVPNVKVNATSPPAEHNIAVEGKTKTN
jgi:hypothetical protein